MVPRGKGFAIGPKFNFGGRNSPGPLGILIAIPKSHRGSPFPPQEGFPNAPHRSGGNLAPKLPEGSKGTGLRAPGAMGWLTPTGAPAEIHKGSLSWRSPKRGPGPPPQIPRDRPLWGFAQSGPPTTMPFPPIEKNRGVGKYTGNGVGSPYGPKGCPDYATPCRF
ncbi:collagen alpha-1(I) chain-like [Penaeus monodon]|uniref:collagen alpha-1(I) chain-like n=1 Tax=Penaeus monodon TaxID=6687 RepID=UPI0018A70D72|nr:collagen alpha-1(I) chain-like [Penaeus monodon]